MSNIDFLAVMEASAKRLRLGVEGPINAKLLDEARAAVAELVEAAGTYYMRYCQDEAAEDGPEVTGCSLDQHFDAARLRAALAKFGGAA